MKLIPDEHSVIEAGSETADVVYAPHYVDPSFFRCVEFGNVGMVGCQAAFAFEARILSCRVETVSSPSQDTRQVVLPDP
jgi:hypothetical protein